MSSEQNSPRQRRARGRSHSRHSSGRQAKALPVETVASADAVKSIAPDERPLVDRFGHKHSRSVLVNWPERVKVAMGLRFCDPSEVEAGHVEAR
jgi:hypothetical protein